MSSNRHLPLLRLLRRIVAWGACCIVFPAATAGESNSAEGRVLLKEGAFAAGMEALSVGMPDSLNSSNAAIEPATSDPGKGGEFLAVPIPRVDPALGSGLVGTAAYIFKLDPEDKQSPPSVIGAAAMLMDSGSWGGGFGGKLYLREDRFRVMAGAVYADLRYNLVAASDGDGNQLTLPLSQEAYGGLAHAQIRVAPNTYVGARVQLGQLGTSLRGESVPELPESVIDSIGTDFQVNSLGPSLAYDTRNSSYYPRDGIAIDAGIDIYFGAIGSEISFRHYDLNYRQYLPVRERDVLAWQAYICAADGNPPFFLQCQVGPNSLLRGYSFGEYRGDAMAAAQAEYRWAVHPRWIIAAFAGVAQVAPRFGDFNFDQNLYSGGVGLRFVVEPKNRVTLRVDYAVGEDEDAVYVSVGEAF